MSSLALRSAVRFFRSAARLCLRVPAQDTAVAALSFSLGSHVGSGSGSLPEPPFLLSFLPSRAADGTVKVGKPVEEVVRYAEAFWRQGPKTFSEEAWKRIKSRVEIKERRLNEVRGRNRVALRCTRAAVLSRGSG